MAQSWVGEDSWWKVWVVQRSCDARGHLDFVRRPVRLERWGQQGGERQLDGLGSCRGGGGGGGGTGESPAEAHRAFASEKPPEVTERGGTPCHSWGPQSGWLSTAGQRPGQGSPGPQLTPSRSVLGKMSQAPASPGAVPVWTTEDGQGRCCPRPPAPTRPWWPGSPCPSTASPWSTSWTDRQLSTPHPVASPFLGHSTTRASVSPRACR